MQQTYFMLKFRNITTADIQTFWEYTLGSSQQNCDFSVANLCGWQFLYNTQWAESDGWLFVRFQIEGRLAYTFPLRKTVAAGGNNASDLRQAILEAYADSLLMGQPFTMLCTGDEAEKAIADAVPVQLQTQCSPDLCDYIYTSGKLQSLAGKKLQSKRNHTNRFRSLYPGYQYVSLSGDTAMQCLELERRWVSSKNPDADNSMSAYDAEYRYMTFALSNWRSLGLTGGAIYVDGTMVAFTFGCPINGDTFDVCIEKADTSYEGAFSIINQEFVRHLPSQYTYINREEDLGNPGLRQAKSSYHPDIRLCKRLVMAAGEGRFTDTETVTRQTERLWRDTFHDPEPFVQLYFSRVFDSSHNITAQLEGQVAGALQLLPHTLKWNSRLLSAAYLSGLAVSDGLRRRGIGSALLTQAHLTAFNKGYGMIMLIPAEEWLFDWYAAHGYAPCASCLAPPAGLAEMDFDAFDAWQQSQPCILLKGQAGFSAYLDDYAATPEHLRQKASLPAMLRVINANVLLSAYAALHPETELTLSVGGDGDLPLNNTCFHITQGTVVQSYSMLPKAVSITISQLPGLLFADALPTMSLMFV